MVVGATRAGSIKRLSLGLGLLAVLTAGCSLHRDLDASAGGSTTVQVDAATGSLVPLIETTVPVVGNPGAVPTVGADGGVTTPGGDPGTETSVASLPGAPSTVAGGGDGGTQPGPVVSTTIPAPVVTAAPATSAPSGGGGVKAGCEAKGGTSGVFRDSGSLSGVSAVEIRTGLHECFDRIVIEFSGDGPFPGYAVQYGSANVAGDAALLVTFGASSSGYGSGSNISAGGLAMVQEIQVASNSDGQTVLAIGIDSQRRFSVSRESSPLRLVIDVRA